LEQFDDYQLYLADREGALVRTKAEQTFGKRFIQRVKVLSPENEEKKDQPPNTVEEFHYHIMDLLSAGKPFIYFLDSLDNLPSKQELEETQSNYDAWKKNKESSGSYGMSKQKYLKKEFREIACQVMSTGSSVIPISQTIAAIGSQFKQKDRAGGSGLDFNSRIIFWLKHLQAFKLKDQVIGRKNRVKFSKNHITHKKRECDLWIFDEIGLDDLRTSIDFLVSQKIWPAVGGWIDPKGMYDGKKYQTQDLIRTIESDDSEDDLKTLLQETWDDIEESLKLQRKSRYE
jgi:RecA/RadA recombinase